MQTDGNRQQTHGGCGCRSITKDDLYLVRRTKNWRSRGEKKQTWQREPLWFYCVCTSKRGWLDTGLVNGQET